MKHIVTWKRKAVTPNCNQDPNTNDRVNIETNGVTTFTETNYCLSDGRFISLVEYPDDCTAESVAYFKTLDPAFEFTFIDELTANTLLAEFGCDESEVQLVTISNFIFTDNRPQDTLWNI